VDRIVATSPNYAKTSPVLLNLSRKVDIVPIGLDPSGYERSDLDLLEAWRAKLPARFFLFVGTLRYYKGLHILIDAAAATNLPTVIVGAGPLEDQLKKRVARLSLTNVVFLGRLPERDKIALLELCHSVIFPSHLRSEAFGVGLLEGAMFGKPLISSEIGSGTSFVNAAGQSGIVVPPSEPQALAQAMRRLWDDPFLAQELGQGALKRFNRYFTAATMAQAYAHIYEALVTGKDDGSTGQAD
jgi:rhamnosyl/mannosyltransferase